MAETVTGLSLRAKFSDDPTLKYRGGKLFVGVLGVEYSIPYFGHLNQAETTIDLLNLPATGNPSPTSLYFSFAKRTANPEEFAYSDGVLPVYLRFQPDLKEPLDDASQNVPSGADFMSQSLTLDQPTVLIAGKIAVHNADDSIAYISKTVEFSIPVNPPSKRVLQLSLQAGLVFFMAKVR